MHRLRLTLVPAASTVFFAALSLASDLILIAGIPDSDAAHLVSLLFRLFSHYILLELLKPTVLFST
jgi:hypothetical protein